jgi:hypothetical protein
MPEITIAQHVFEQLELSRPFPYEVGAPLWNGRRRIIIDGPTALRISQATQPGDMLYDQPILRIACGAEDEKRRRVMRGWLDARRAGEAE